MTVQCPRCSTQYRVPETRLSDARPVFKCTRCNHVFSVGADRPPARASRKRAESRNLSFTFDDPRDTEVTTVAAEEEIDEEAADDEVEAIEEEEAGAEEEEEVQPARRSSRAGANRPEPAFVDDLPRERPAPPSRPKRPPAPRREEPRDEDQDDDPILEDEDDGPVLVGSSQRARRAPINPRRKPRGNRDRRSPLRPMAIGVGVVVLAFAVAALALNRRPDLALDQLGSVPLLGRLLGDDRLLVWRLQIEDVNGTMDRIKGDRPAYVVSGRVLNGSGQNLRLVEIEGRLLADGVERRKQLVYAANQFRKTIRDLSASEVEMLLRLEPNRRFVIRPGESASFLLVFPDPPSNTTEVTFRVVDARPA